MPDYSSFIRSVRIRYLSGLLIFTLATAATIYALNTISSFRRDVDNVSGQLIALTKDLRNATDFAETASGNWRAGTRGDLAAVARDYVGRIGGRIELLSARIDALTPGLSKQTRDVLASASVNGDLFWSARDMVRNLNLMAAATTVDDWSPRAISNQNNLFVQPMLLKARAAMDAVLPASSLDGRDASVGGLVEERFGKEIVDRLVEPLLGGVYAGHAREISARAAVGCG